MTFAAGFGAGDGHIGGGGHISGGGAVTVTVALQVLEPPEPKTFAVYEVVEAGLTFIVPPVGAISAPFRTADCTLPDVVILRVVELHFSISFGDAVNEHVGGGGQRAFAFAVASMAIAIA